ncbi:MAG TPA: sterol desaturase family protein [bacterium]|nr:sterol desaturase family protein [bacterium]
MHIALGAGEIKILVQVGALALILCLEAVFPLFQGRKERFRHIGRNLAVGLLNGILLALLFSTLTASVTLRAQETGFGLLSTLSCPPWAETLLALFLFDLWMYLWHRANHRIPFLWRFHRMHHTDDQLDVSSALRFHTGELVLSSLLRLAVVPLLGMSLSQLILYETLLQPIILFHHSNVALPERFDRVLRFLIVTPNMHRVHHSQERFETDSNYSSVFSFWDRLGKSFRRRPDPLTLRYGLPEFPDEKWQTVAGMLKTPLAHSQ